MVLRELVIALGLDVDGAAFSQAEKAIMGLKSGAMGVVAAIGAVGVGLATAAGFTAKTADRVDELSQSLGVSADELQRLGYAAGFSGLSMEQVGQSMKFLAKSGVKDVRGELLRLSDQFSKMPNGGEKTALALKKLGRQGADLIPMLNEGREKLEELFAEAPVMDPDTIRSGVELADAVTRIQGALKKFVFMVGAPLLKPLGQLATTLVKWFNANEKLINHGVLVFVEHFKGVVEGLWSVVARAARGFDMLAQALGGWGKVIAVAAAGLGVFAIALNPITAGLGLLLLILDDVAGYFEGKDSVTGDLIKGWKDLMKLMFEAPNAEDSALVKFLKATGEELMKIRDFAIETARVIKALTGKDAVGATSMTSAERTANRSEWQTVMEMQKQRGITMPTVNQTDVGPGSGWRPVNKIDKVEIKVDGSKDPKATAEAVRDELGALLEMTHEVYS
jgi:hypothetical protein